MIKDCFDKGLLRKTKKDAEASKGSVKIARSFIEKAEANIKIGLHDVAFLMAYNSMFHSVKAFLFLQGISERSHYCAIKYAVENISDEKIQPVLEALDSYRVSRHRIQYDGEGMEKENAKEAVNDAKRLADFIGNKTSHDKVDKK